MAYKTSHETDLNTDNSSQNLTTFKADGASSIEVPDESFIRDADMTRDGVDLVLNGPDGVIVIEGYFTAEPQPNIIAPNGQSLSPQLVDSFAKSPMEYADSGSLTDESPVGGVQEVSGTATVTRVDGTVENIVIGTPIYQGDIIETSGQGAVNITFIDETSFAVSEDARLAIDEYVFDPSTQSGTTNFSVLKGVFVFTSGLIGRDDPDDVEIETPHGSIGIRGTIIAGNVNTGEITVIEGAIVLRSLTGVEMTLASQFETARFGTEDGEIENLGQMDASEVISNFSSISTVSPDLFSSIEDAAAENNDNSQDDSDGNSDGNNDSDNDNDSGLPDDDDGMGNDDGDGQNSFDDDGSDDDSDNDNDDDGTGDDGDDYNQPPPDNNEDPVIRGFNGPEELLEGLGNAGSGSSWSFNFGKVFTDPDGPDGAMTYQYQLDSGLTNLVDNGLATINFNASTGQMTIDFAEILSGTDGLFDSFNISVFATDADGGTSDAFTFELDVFNTGAVVSGGGTLDQYSTIGSGNFTTVDDNSYVFFAENTMDTNLTIYGNNTFVRTDDEGVNTINVTSTTDNLTIIGGAGQDNININNVTGLNVFTGAGNDTFTLTSSAAFELENSSDNASLYAGGQDVKVGTQSYANGRELLNDIINTNNFNNGSGNNIEFGDTLALSGAVDINFATINTSGNQIHGIEVIDANNGAVNNIILDLATVIDMTGPENFLVINIDVNDALELSGFSADNLAQDNVLLDMDGDGTSEYYDVYNVDGVTLFIQDTAGATDGTANVTFT